MKAEQRDKIIAGVVTFLVAVLLLVGCFYTKITTGMSALAQASIPETGNDEFFIETEPEIDELLNAQNLENPGAPEQTSEEMTSPSEAFSGEPEHAEVEVKQRIEPGKNTNQAPPVSATPTQKQPSPVKTTESQQTDKKKQAATSPRVSPNAFSGRNGAEQGSSFGSGASTGQGSGLSVTGSISGRKFLGITKFTPVLKQKTVVKVSIVVNAAGKVTKATYSSGTTDASLRRRCEQAALTARWSESPGAADARGMLTFTITPK